MMKVTTAAVLRTRLKTALQSPLWEPPASQSLRIFLHYVQFFRLFP
jgi:hypothetical protein